MAGRLSRLADRLAVYLYRNGSVYELDCPHCDRTHDVPMRHVTVYVTAYLRESFATARCATCGRVVAQDEPLDVCENLMNAGAKFRVFHEPAPITEGYVNRFVAALDDPHIVDLARENR